MADQSAANSDSTQLSEQVTKTLHIDDSSSNKTTMTPNEAAPAVASAPLPPSKQDDGKKKPTTADELFKELNRIPFFMTSLDDTDGEGGENELLEAMKALAYEGTRAEIATNFKNHGNEAVSEKRWQDAREFYNKALAALKGPVHPQDADEGPADVRVVEIDEEAEEERERKLHEACYANRALCNLEMKNYASCNKDCAATLKLNVRNVKAWYRAGSACLALDRIPAALDACQSGLRWDPNNAALKALLARVEKRQTYLEELQRARTEREERTHRHTNNLQMALRSRGIAARTTKDPPDMEDAAIKLEDAEDPTSTLAFPVILLYPLHAQSDFVKACGEGESLGEHLSYILPTPWDSQGEYTPAGVECYLETAQGGLVKAGKKLSLLKLLAGGKVEVVDGLVRVNVVPKAKASQWIEQFKLRRGKQ